MEIDRIGRPLRPTDDELRRTALQLYHSDEHRRRDLHITITSVSSPVQRVDCANGAYVQAWLWVAYSEVKP